MKEGSRGAFLKRFGKISLVAAVAFPTVSLGVRRSRIELIRLLEEDCVFDALDRKEGIGRKEAEASLFLLRDHIRDTDLSRDIYHKIAVVNKLELTKDELDGKTDSRFKSLVTYPCTDWNTAFRYHDGSMGRFMSGMRDHYGVQFVFTRREEEVYSAIAGQDLLVSVGHGIDGGKGLRLLSLDNCSPEERREPSERFKLDIEDREFEGNLNRLAPNARIVLLSCATGANNGLASYVASMAKGRKVFASRTDFPIRQVDVKSWRPFEMEVKNKGNTYVSN